MEPEADTRLPTMHGYGYSRLTLQQYQHAWSNDIARRAELAGEELAMRQRMMGHSQYDAGQPKNSAAAEDGELRSQLSARASSVSTSAPSTVSSYMTGLSEGVSRIERLELKLERERRKRRELELALERAQQPGFLQLFGSGENGPWGREPH